MEDLQKLVAQYKSEPFVKNINAIMEKILWLSVPTMVLDLKTGKFEFKIDEKTQDLITFYRQKLEEYKENYFQGMGVGVDVYR